MTDDEFRKLLRDVPVKARAALDQHWAGLSDDILGISVDLRINRLSELSPDDVRSMSDTELRHMIRLAGIAFKEALTRKTEKDVRGAR